MSEPRTWRRFRAADPPAPPRGRAGRVLASVRLAGRLAGLLLLAAGPAAAQGGAPSPPQPQSQPQPQPQPQPVTHEPMVAGEATTILGRQVRGLDGNPVGRITDVLVDQAGQARAAVVDVGGFMGVGQRRIAVAWRALRFNPGDGTIVLQLAPDQVAAAPEYKPGGAPVVVAAPP